MPIPKLNNLDESLLGYWLKLTTVTRDMIKITPEDRLPVVFQGQRVPIDQELRSKSIHKRKFKITNIFKCIRIMIPISN